MSRASIEGAEIPVTEEKSTKSTAAERGRTRSRAVDSARAGEVGGDPDEDLVRAPERPEIAIALEWKGGVPGVDPTVAVHALENGAMGVLVRDEREQLRGDLRLGVAGSPGTTGATAAMRVIS